MVRSKARTDFVDISGQGAEAVWQLDMVESAIIVFNPHTTAAVTINEGADPDVVQDMSKALDKLVPWEDGYRHGEGNPAGHIKASMFGSSVTVMVEEGRLQLGTW